MNQQIRAPSGELNASLSVYLPIDRRIALAQHKPMPDRSRGTALFADISGFTPLTAALAEELGPQRGAEELTLHLNRVYGALVAEVHRYHGSVVGFSGDAITCWFEEPDSSVSAKEGRRVDSAKLAASCALAIQQTMKRFSAISTGSGADILFSVKIAISAGQARRFQVGNPEIQCIDTLAGSTLDRLALIERQARQGDVLLEAQIVEQLGAGAVASLLPVEAAGMPIYALTELKSPAETLPWPEVPELPADVARSWLIPPVFRRLQRGEGEFLSELRSAVALFARFTGLDYDGDDGAGEKLDAYVRWVQSILARYQGYLIALTMGDKGSHLHASFGALVAHEDDVIRAVATALELQNAPAELDFIGGLQIGIGQGPMRTGAYGGRTRRTYGVHGVQVNVASRLMSRADPGQILVTQAVANAAASFTEFQALGALSFKGLGIPVQTFEVRGQRKGGAAEVVAHGALTPIVGREAERAGLTKQLEALQIGQSSNAVIEGQAGIGKSRLMSEFVAQVDRLGIPWLMGAGLALEQNTAYHAWRPIFRALLGLGETVSVSDAREIVLEHLGDRPHFEERAPLLNDVLPLGLQDNKLTAGMTGKVRADNTRAMLVHLLQVARPDSVRPDSDSYDSGPLVIVLDDGHWLDSASWALLDQVRRESSRLMLVVLMRPSAQDPAGSSGREGYQALLSAPTTEYYQLDSMPPEDTLALVSRRLGVDRLPEPIGQLVLERAEGHPFFSEEIAFALRDAGFIRIEDGQVVQTEGVNLRELDFPDTIQGVITSRIDQLEPGQELALKVASVIGRVFLFRALKDIYPVATDQPHLEQYLGTLARLDITPLETREPELTYSFRHAIMQEVVYGLLLYQQRRDLHEAVATWYEITYAADLSRFYPLLAYHWGKANNVPKTISYLEKAGEQALRRYANREAIEFLQEALALDQGAHLASSAAEPADDLRRARWLRQLGEAHLGLGQLNESRSALLRMLSRVKRPAPASQSRLVLALLKQLLIQIRHRLQPSRFLGRSLGEEAGIFLEVARANQHLAEIYYFANERALTLNAGLNVLNFSERVAPSPELARAYANMVVIAGLIPWHRAAEAYSRWALETAGAVGDLPALAWVQLLVGTYEVGLGRWQPAAEKGSAAIELCRQLGDQRQLGLSLGLLAIVPISAGRFAESRELYVEWYDIADEGGNIQHQAFGLFGQAENDLPFGRLKQAASFAEQGLQLLIEKTERTVENRTAEIRGYGLAAAAYVRQGEHQLALAAADEALNVVSQLSTPTRVTLLEGLSGVAEAYLRLWEENALPASTGKSLQDSAKRACKVLRQYARMFPIGQPRAHLWQGLFYWIEGHRRRALDAWSKSLAEAERLVMPYDGALAHFEIGRHSTGHEREHHLTQAFDVFESLDASYNLALVKAVQQADQDRK